MCHTQIGSGVGGADSISAASHPAVWSSCREMKLLKLTYYLLDWANMFVLCFFFSHSVFNRVWQSYHRNCNAQEITCLGVLRPPGCMVTVCVCTAYECVSISFMVYVCGRVRVCACARLRGYMGQP